VKPPKTNNAIVAAIQKKKDGRKADRAVLSEITLAIEA
jgi:hypothetical protein